MKFCAIRLVIVFVLTLQLACCGDLLPPRYALELPQPPEHWISLLGEPHWRLEWFDTGGHRQVADILPRSSLEIEIPVTWTNPIAAWPYWPEHNLSPGNFKPAGAIFPFDVSKNRLYLSWKAGPDAVFYRELINANSQNTAKSPAYFDWPRFRSLFETETMNEAVRKDPWLVNWSSVAERTINSSFDQRRLVPETAVNINIPVNSGFWYGTSPFAEPLYFAEDETPAFPVRSGINIWISAHGILRFNNKVWVFKAW